MISATGAQTGLLWRTSGKNFLGLAEYLVARRHRVDQTQADTPDHWAVRREIRRWHQQRLDHEVAGEGVSVAHKVALQPIDLEERHFAWVDYGQILKRIVLRHFSPRFSTNFARNGHNSAIAGRVPVTFPRALYARLQAACRTSASDARQPSRAALILLALSLLTALCGALATAALLVFLAAFLSLIAPSLIAIFDDRARLDRDFRFTATRLRLGLPIMGDF